MNIQEVQEKINAVRNTLGDGQFVTICVLVALCAAVYFGTLLTDAVRKKQAHKH